MPDQAPLLTDRFQDAFILAFELHRNQKRKGSDTPYITHLMTVAGLVLEHGGDEDEAIAALLHDAVEDQGGSPTLERIRHLFGDRVATIVETCSDSVDASKTPWRTRKENYLRKLETCSISTLRVSQADKYHNLGTLYMDYLEVGDKIWDRFQGGKEGTLWYYHELNKVFHLHGKTSLLREIDRLLGELDRIVQM